MAEAAVTYADLRFAKSPPEQSRPPREVQDGGSDGELTYENFSAARPRQEGRPGSPQQDPGPLPPRRLWPPAPLALLGACLVLLATCVGLGVRYWQVSQQLQRASQRHAAENSALAHRLGAREENLTRALAELAATRLALGHSWQVGNSTRRQLEEERQQREGAEESLRLLQQQKDKAIQELAATKRVLDHVASCQQIDCCPQGWKLFNQKCLRFSSASNAWEESKQDCERHEAQLLMLKPWAADTVWDAAVLMSHLQSEEFWVGLTRTYEWNWKWHWVDGTPYAGTKEFDYYYYYYKNCGKMSQGTLKQEDCSSKLRYICETAAPPFSWSIDPSS